MYVSFILLKLFSLSNFSSLSPLDFCDQVTSIFCPSLTDVVQRPARALTVFKNWRFRYCQGYRSSQDILHKKHRHSWVCCSEIIHLIGLVTWHQRFAILRKKDIQIKQIVQYIYLPTLTLTVWSFAMVLYEMIMQNPPYYDRQHFDIWNLCSKGERPSFTALTPEREEQLRPLLKLFMKCTELNPEKRPSAKKVISKLGQLT